MKVCLLSKFFGDARGGIESYTRFLAAELGQRGHEVHIVARGEQSSSERTEAGYYVHRVGFSDWSFRGAQRIERFIPLSWLTYSYRIFRTVERLVREHGVEIVEAPNWGLEAFWSSIVRRVPVVVRIHVPTPEYARLRVMPFAVRARAVLGLEQMMARRAALLTAPSRSAAVLVETSYGLRRPVAIIPNSVDRHLFRPAPEKRAVRPTLLFVGRFETNKGIECLSGAAPAIREAVEDVRFVIVGSEPDDYRGRRGWAERLRESIPSGQLILPGEVARERLAGYYQESWVSVAPSLSETFGLSVLEAMSCATPVVASAIGAFKEVITDGENGLLAPPGDAPALARAVIRLLTDRDLRERLGARARETVRERFPSDSLAELTMEAYQAARARGKR